MCGRYFFYAQPKKIAQRFDVKVDEEYWKARYNAAPTQFLPVILNTASDVLDYLSWGLIPSWSADAKIASSLINARAETITEKPSFKKAFEQKRCLVVANGFYEWLTEGKTKVPMKVQIGDGELFAMAGIWEEWMAPNKVLQRTFSIVTVPACSATEHVHHRMPAFLTKDTERVWLHSNSISELHQCLTPYQGADIVVSEASKRVNKAREDDERLLHPEQEDNANELTLF